MPLSPTKVVRKTPRLPIRTPCLAHYRTPSSTLIDTPRQLTHRSPRPLYRPHPRDPLTDTATLRLASIRRNRAATRRRARLPTSPRTAPPALLPIAQVRRLTSDITDIITSVIITRTRTRIRGGDPAHAIAITALHTSPCPRYFKACSTRWRSRGRWGLWRASGTWTSRTTCTIRERPPLPCDLPFRSLTLTSA